MADLNSPSAVPEKAADIIITDANLYKRLLKGNFFLRRSGKNIAKHSKVILLIPIDAN
jgi:hypothetical protein